MGCTLLLSVFAGSEVGNDVVGACNEPDGRDHRFEHDIVEFLVPVGGRILRHDQIVEAVGQGESSRAYGHAAGHPHQDHRLDGLVAKILFEVVTLEYPERPIEEDRFAFLRGQLLDHLDIRSTHQVHSVLLDRRPESPIETGCI